MKKTITAIITALHNIVSPYLASGVVPLQQKIAKVVPVSNQSM
jgi:hypothetical protein